MPIQLCVSLLCHHNNAITTFCFVSSCSSHHTFFFSVIMTMSSNIMCYFIMSMLLHFPFLCLRVNAFNLLPLSSCQCIPTELFCVVVSMPLNFPFLGYHVNAITLSVSEVIDKNNTGKCDDIDICQCHHTFLCYRVNVSMSSHFPVLSCQCLHTFMFCHHVSASNSEFCFCKHPYKINYSLTYFMPFLILENIAFRSVFFFFLTKQLLLFLILRSGFSDENVTHSR